MARLDDAFDHLVPRRVDLDHVNVGPRRHDVRHVRVAQFDHAFDHLAGLFFEQALAVALAHDRANFLFDRFLVGSLFARPTTRCKHAIDPVGTPHQRLCQRPTNRHSGQVE